MKHLAILLITALAALACQGQRHVDDAIARLARNGDARQVKMYEETDTDGRMCGRLQIHHFTSPLALNELLNAFEQDDADAYYTLREEAGDSVRRTTALTYGTDGESVLVGSDAASSYRVLCFLDPGRGDFRTGYVVEWTKIACDSVDGRVISTYGRRPSSSKRSGAKARVFSLGDLGALDSLRFDDEDLQVLRKLGPAVKGVIGDIAGAGADVIEALKSSGIDLEGIADSETLKSLGDVVVGTVEDPDTEFTDDVSWLTAFNHYRNAFHRAAKRQSTSAAAYATSLLKLCKQAHRVGLTSNEKKLCVKSIKEMRKATRDTFIQGLLDEAATLLR